MFVLTLASRGQIKVHRKTRGIATAVLITLRSHQQNITWSVSQADKASQESGVDRSIVWTG